MVPGAPRCALGEGAVWDPRNASVVWVDLLVGRIHVLDPSSSHASDDVRTVDVGRPVSKALPEGDGWLVVAELGLERRDRDWRLLSSRDLLDPADGLRMNDAALDGHGRCYLGTLAYDDSPGRASLYRWDPDGSVTELRSRLGIANGLGWSPDGRRLYHVDSLARAVTSWSLDAAGGIDDGMLLYEHPGPGLPDGLAVDATGCLWVAVWDGGCVLRLSPTGQVLQEVAIPAARPTSLCFGGPDLATAFVTSAQDDQGRGGELFCFRPETPGLPSPTTGEHPHRLEGSTP